VPNYWPPNRIVVETDESDGTITNFHAGIAVLTNISEDHKGLDELMDIFRQFLSQSKMQVLNIDCPNVAKLATEFPDAVTYSNTGDVDLIVPGKHNQSNAQAALAVGRLCHLDGAKSLNEFKGITSRLEVVGVKNNITVIDDFGHNPDKIEAGLKTLKENGKRLILMYQPHGFKPTRDHKHELIDVFAKYPYALWARVMIVFVRWHSIFLKALIDGFINTNGFRGIGWCRGYGKAIWAQGRISWCDLWHHTRYGCLYPHG